MQFVDVHALVDGIPHMTKDQGRTVHDFLLRKGSTRVLELGFAHGVSTCVFAAAMEETGGHVTTIDRVSAQHREPNIYELLERTGLADRVTVVLEETSYTWALMRFLEQDPMPRFDFVYVDGAHSWDVDGFAFYLVDQLLEPGGWILFDDLNWCLAGSPTMSALPEVLALPEIQQRTRQVRKVFRLLVRRHPNYDRFRDADNWGWARKKPVPKPPAPAPGPRSTASRMFGQLPPPWQKRIRRSRRAVVAGVSALGEQRRRPR